MVHEENDPQPVSDITTSHSYFLRPSHQPSHPPVALLLRGVNLSSTSKYPSFTDTQLAKLGGTRDERDKRRSHAAGMQSHLGERAGLYSEAEAGGRDGWFVGHPLLLDEADVRELRGVIDSRHTYAA
jgi:hypothetical protein